MYSVIRKRPQPWGDKTQDKRPRTQVIRGKWRFFCVGGIYTPESGERGGETGAFEMKYLLEIAAAVARGERDNNIHKLAQERKAEIGEEMKGVCVEDVLFENDLCSLYTIQIFVIDANGIEVKDVKGNSLRILNDMYYWFSGEMTDSQFVEYIGIVFCKISNH